MKGGTFLDNREYRQGGREAYGCQLLREGSFANTFWYNPNPTPESSEGTGDKIFCGAAGVTVAFVDVLASEVFLFLCPLAAPVETAGFVLESHAERVIVALA